MSDDKRRGGGAPQGDDDVGFGRPPREFQYKPGQSGNPKGRPRGARKARQAQTAADSFGHQLAEDWLLEEVRRLVTIREGSKMVTLPALQVACRARMTAAMKGSRLALRDIENKVQEIERQHYEALRKLNRTWLDYKLDWQVALDAARAAGEPEPKIPFEPEHIHINATTGEVNYYGPKTDEEKRLREKRLSARDEYQEDISYFAEQYRNAPTKKHKEIYLKSWICDQAWYDFLNDNFPPHRRVKLKDRCYKKDATRPGDMVYTIWPEGHIMVERYREVNEKLEARKNWRPTDEDQSPSAA